MNHLVFHPPKDPTDISSIKTETRFCTECDRKFVVKTSSKQRFCGQFCMTKKLGGNQTYHRNYTQAQLDADLAKLEDTDEGIDNLEALIGR